MLPVINPKLLHVVTRTLLSGADNSILFQTVNKLTYFTTVCYMQFTCSFAPVMKIYARRAFPIIIIVKIIPLADLFFCV